MLCPVWIAVELKLDCSVLSKLDSNQLVKGKSSGRGGGGGAGGDDGWQGRLGGPALLRVGR